MEQEPNYRDELAGLLKALIYVLCLWALIAALATCGRAKGGEVRLTWNANPASESVSEYKIWKVEGTVRTKIGSVTTNAATITAEPGWLVTVTAFNGQDSDPAAPITIPAPIPAPGIMLIVESSTDLVTWAEIASHVLPRKESEFFRLRLINPTPP